MKQLYAVVVVVEIVKVAINPFNPENIKLSIC